MRAQKVAPIAALILALTMLFFTLPFGPSKEPVFVPHFGAGRALPMSGLVVVNQVSPQQIPEAPIRAAVEAYNLTYVSPAQAGPGRCRHSKPGEQVICVSSLHESLCPCWSYWYFSGAGIVLDTRLASAPVWEVQEAVCHEVGNAIGIPENFGTPTSCMDMHMDGQTQPPASVPEVHIPAPVSAPVPEPITSLTKRAVSTAYCTHSRRTASGAYPHPGTAAVNSVPFGTQIHVLSGPISGAILTVEDRHKPGSTNVDIWMDNCAAAHQYGRRIITIHLAPPPFFPAQ